MKGLLEVLVIVAMCTTGAWSRRSVGDACRTWGGQLGVCSPQSLCSVKTNSPKHCFWMGEVRIICCPGVVTSVTSTPRTTSTETVTYPDDGIEPRFGDSDVSKSKCVEYTKDEIRRGRTCPGSGTMIAGGLPALPFEFPHMAILGKGRIDAPVWFCGGSLISKRFVLTAAHCIRSAESSSLKWVRLGDLNLASTTDNARPETIGVEKTIKHPLYTASTYYYDIALVKLERDVQFSKFIRPACLHTTETDPPGTRVIATGWGKNGYYENTGSDALMKVQITTRSLATCNGEFSYLRHSSKLKRGIVTDMICAADDKKDTCQGDSGGPIQTKLGNCMYSVMGVTSFGNAACGTGNSSAVYTRVSRYLTWIEEHVWPAHSNSS